MTAARPVPVICVGLNRTGTGTLRAALGQLGYRVAVFDPDMITAWQAGDLPQLLAEARRHDVLSDLPWPLLYRELHAAFGDRARYVLTTRASAEVWVASQRMHTERTAPGTRANRLAYGLPYPHGAEDSYAAFYDAHNAAVRTHFGHAPGIFAELCWERGDGWARLCAFLGHPVPPQPFPHKNASAMAPVDPQRAAANRLQIASQIESLKR